MKLIFWILFSILFFSCQEEDTIISEDNSQDYFISYKEYTLDSLSGNVTNSEINVHDFQSAQECKECHLQHYQEWEASFHAHAFNDELFFSMWESEKEDRPITGVNYCVQCHAPAAFVSGYDLDGIDFTNVETLPSSIHEGVSCDICHTMVDKSPSVHTQDHVAAVAKYYLNPGENIKFGSNQSPDSNSFHQSEYLPLFNSSSSCLPCHNQSIRGMPLEMTFSEWDDHAGLSMAGPSCQKCHMPKESNGHSSHYFAGVDALFYNGVDESSPQYQQIKAILEETVDISFSRVNTQDGSLDSIKVLNDTLYIPITVNNLAGHRFPSGTAFAREGWLELLVFNSQGDTIYSKGVIENSTELLDYNDEELMFYTQILYDQENHGGNITNSASNAYSYKDHTIPTLFYDAKTYKIAIHEDFNGNIIIKAKMNFRAFKPQIINEFHPQSISNIPIMEMDSDSCYINF